MLPVSHQHVITAEQALIKLKNEHGESSPVLLDARDLWPMYYWSHAQHALHSPWRTFTLGRRSGLLRPHDELQALMRSLGIEQEREVIIYADWERGWGEEARMLWLLEYLGHDKAFVVEGGWLALKAAGINKSWGNSPLTTPSSWSITVQADRRIVASQVASHVTSGQLSIDARSKREFEGETPYGSSYGGHLKGSIHLPWKQLLNEDQSLKSPQELRELFFALGLKQDQAIFAYCTGGIRSAFVYLALREAGFERAMNYDGSWWEWTELYSEAGIPLDLRVE